MDDRDLIRRFFGEPEADPAARNAARERLEAAMRGRWRRTGIPRISLAAAVIAVLVVSALVWSTARPQSAAARAFDALADIPVTGLEPGPDEFLHQVSSEFRTETSQMIDGGTFRVQVQLGIDLWLRADGSGERRSVVEAVTFASPEDERAWSQPGAPALPVIGKVRRDRFDPGEGPLVAAADIPTDPVALLAALRDGAIQPNGSGDASAFEFIGELLAQGNLPATTRSALLGTAAKLDGVRLLGPAQDAMGREGESFSVQVANQETRLIFDPVTGAFLSREIYEPTPSGAWELVDWRTYTPVEIVQRIPPFES